MPSVPFWSEYVDLIEWCLQRLTSLTGSAGIAIILFTIALKTVLLPLTVKSIKSTAAMQELQPKIKELQKKYAKDRQRLSMETMQLYQEYQINPAAGCLPMLIQIPIFFGLYFAVTDLSKGGGDFLWFNLREADPYKALPILAGIFQFIQTRMMRPHNAPKVTDPQQQMMNTMMNFMPLMVVVFGWSFPSGAVLYWVAQSIYSVVQQWFITGWGSMKNWFAWLPDLPEHRRLGHRKQPLERKQIDPNARPKGLMGRLQQRAADMEEQQRKRGTVAGAAPEKAPLAAASTTPGTGKRARQAKTDVRNANGAGENETINGTATRVMTGRSRESSRRARGATGNRRPDA